MRYLRTNTAIRLTVGPFLDKTDGVTPETAITVTSEKLTFVVDDGNVPTLVLDAAPTASGGFNDMVHITGDDAGFYDLELTAANVNYLGRAMLSLNDAAVHCPVFHEFMIVPAVVYDALFLGTDLIQSDLTQILGDGQSATDIKDFADAGYDPATNKVEGVKLADTLTTYTGNTVQTGDSFARIGATGSGLTSLASQASVDTLDNFVDTEVAAIITTLGTPSNLGSGATVAGNLVDIENQTDDIGVAGAGLTVLASAVNLATLAGYVDTEVAAILADTNELQTDWVNGGRLDNILDARASQTSVDDLPTNAELATSQAAADDATLAAIAALNNPSAAGIADAVWEEAVADHSGTVGSTAEQLAAAGAGGDPWLTDLPGAYASGTAGQILGDNLNATVSSRASQTSVDDIPTNAELATSQASADDATLAAIAALNNLSAAQVNTEVDTALSDVGLTTTVTGRVDAAISTRASQTSVDDLPTNAELATSQAAADDATLAAIAALNNLSAAQVNTEVDTALADINLDHLVKSAVDTDFPTTVHLNSVVGHLADNGTTATFDRTTDSLEAQQAEHDATQAAVNVVDDLLDTEVAAIKADTAAILIDTAEIGVAGAGLTALATQASVNTIDDFLDTEIAAILTAVDTEVAAILADTNELQTDWANGGRLDNILDARSSQSSVDDIPTNAELATALAAADDAVLAAITALNNLSAAQVNAEVVDALNVDVYGEPGQEAPGASVPITKKIGYLYKAFRNKFTQDATESKLYADNGTTVDQKSTVSDDGTTFVRGEFISGP